MFIRVLILLSSLMALSHAVESCIDDALLLPGPELTAGLNKFNVLLPQFADQCRATVQFAPDSISGPLRYNFTTVDCVGVHNAAFIEIPKYVPNGAATLIWQCKDMDPCGMPLYIYGGVEDPLASREQEGQIGCWPDILVGSATPPWSFLMVVSYKRSLPRANVKNSFPLKNITTASPLWATASSALWAAASGLPARTNSSSQNPLNITTQAPSSWGGTAPAPFNWPASIENITSAPATTVESQQYTPISIHPTISPVKPPGKPTGDPTLSYSIPNHDAPLAFAIALAITATVFQAIHS